MTVNQEKKREGWVDIAKGIAITAVVFGHMTITGLNHDLFPVQTLFAVLWHVSVFFLIGGFFIKEEKLVGPFGFIKGKVKSLYLLILYIYIPVLLLHNFFLNIGFYDVSIEYYGKYVTYWGIKDLLINTIQAVCFAGREPLLGAMWFVYVLFMALCIFSVLSWGTKKVTSEEKHYEALRFGVIFLLAVISSTMTEVLHVNIPRCNNVFTAVLLIYVGMKAYQKYHLRFDNVFIALLCAIIVWHIGTTKGYVSLVENKMPNVVSMLASSSAALYVVCFFSRKLDTVKWGGYFARLARNLSTLWDFISSDSRYALSY